MTSLKLHKFDMSSIKDHSIIVLIGKRGTGKSYLVRDFLYHKQDIPVGTVVSPTEKMNKYMFKYIDMKITKAFGKNTIMGSANGGLMLEMDIDNVIDVGENGDEWIETPLP